jgi:hypothetical protein
MPGWLARSAGGKEEKKRDNNRDPDQAPAVGIVSCSAGLTYSQS